jgi:ribonuclease P protein component
MLAFKNRFHGHGSLKYVYTNGATVRSRLISLKHSTHPKRKEPRIAVVVSKKVIKSAVARNRIRRRIYETVRLELPKIKPSKDIVLIVFSSEMMTLPAKELTDTIQQLFSDGDIYLK